jgi:hypothetical protein
LVADRGRHQESESSRVKDAGCGASPDAAASPNGAVAGDVRGATAWATGVLLNNCRGEHNFKASVLFPAAPLVTLASPGANRVVGETLLFCLLERSLLDHDALALIALPRPAEANDHR